ncbi:MAG TPA: hypothetical protein VIP82_19125 [Microbacterium sp.]|uniref:hypothetical protein n=1 Tax=Microbacterium sp. TaxID=51671 RepID=UPI002F95BA4F
MSEQPPWRPIVATGREDVLTEGFPVYLREAIYPWMSARAGADGGWAKADFFVEFQNAAKTDIGFRSGGYHKWRDAVLPQLRAVDDAVFTNLVHYGLSRHFVSQGTKTLPLEDVLSDGGSAWTVVRAGNYAALTQRVPDGVRTAMASVLSATDVASRKLQEAWSDAYGVNPRPSVAFGHAVVAVETAALTVIPTPVPEPTLANLFSILEADNPKWTLVFRDSDKAPGAKTLAAMMRTLWRGHESRHGRPDYADATLEEARAAVILAATLVQWFTTGVVRPTQ